MPQTLKFYLNNSYQLSELKEIVCNDTNLTGDAVRVLANQLYDKFYQVGFTVEFDEAGNIVCVTKD